jgi:hypothetical protein
MTVPVATSDKTTFTANGLTTIFTSSFTVFDVGHVVIRIDSVIQETGFTLAILPSTTYGSVVAVTFTVAPTNGQAVRLNRVVPIKQDISFTNNSVFDIKNLERSLDTLTLIAQRLLSSTDLAFKFDQSVSTFNSTSETATSVTATKTERATKGLRFDSNGDLTISITDPDQPQLAAETAKTAAELAQAASEAARDLSLAYRDTAEDHKDDAYTYMTGLDLPAVTVGTAQYYLRVNVAGDGYELVSAATASTPNTGQFYGFKVVSGSLNVDHSSAGDDATSYDVSNYVDYHFGAAGQSYQINSAGHLVATFV